MMIDDDGCSCPVEMDRQQRWKKMMDGWKGMKGENKQQ